VSPNRITIDVDGDVSVLDHGGSGPLIVCVHGLEGSAYNWNLIGPDLTASHRVVAPDLSGFGYTPPAGRGASVEVNAEVVAGVIEEFGDRAILIGNSMGGLISMIVADRHPNLVSGLVLIDPAAPISHWLRIRPGAAARLSTPLIPRVGGALIRRYRALQTPSQTVAEVLNFVAADAAAMDPSVWADALEIATVRRTQPWATDALVEATTSIAPYVLVRPLFAPLLHRISPPTLLIHGTDDALIQVETARWMAMERPDWTHAFLDGVGHVPMLEVPSTVVKVIETWDAAVFAR
jgi:pimeloyl-ACP methyl ester carboxylesterase